VLDNINGIPTHALLVHVVVVLLPLAALTGTAVAVVPALRRRYGGLVLLLTLGAVAAVPLTQQAGERLFDRLSARFGPDDVAEAGLMERHADLARTLLPWALVLLAGVALVVLPPLLARRQVGAHAVPVTVGGGAGAEATAEPEATPAWTRPVALLAAAVTLVGAVASVVLVVRIGDLGSQAAWERLDQPAGSMAPLGR
jgi:hypothetical protein